MHKVIDKANIHVKHISGVDNFQFASISLELHAVRHALHPHRDPAFLYRLLHRHQPHHRYARASLLLQQNVT